MDEPTLGEINRTVARLERAINNLTDQMQTALGPVGELKVRVTMAEDDIDNVARKVNSATERLEERVRMTEERFDERQREIDTKIEDVRVQAAKLSGAIGFAAFAASLIPWPFKWRL